MPPSEKKVATVTSVAPNATAPKSSGTSKRASTMLPARAIICVIAVRPAIRSAPAVARRLTSVGSISPSGERIASLRPFGVGVEA